ncbi:MAG: pyridoxal phosphate-dependent aminotransferase [Candidatus Omnitrophota bacterium]
MKIAKRLEKVSPSLTLEVTNLAKKLKDQGRAIVNFAGGEPDFDTPEHIKLAAIAAIKEGFTKYTPSSGTAQLKKAIAQKFLQDNHLSYTPEQIIVSCGAKHSIYNIILALCEKGDEVIMGSPYWLSYPEMVALAEAKAKIVKTPLKKNFKLDKESLQRSINKKSKLLILNSPSNPTGAVYTRDELKEIVEVVLRHNLYVISDEIYEKLIYDGQEHVSCASLGKEIFQRTIVVNGVSKSYAMTGWRIGYLASPDKEIVNAIDTLQSHSTSNPCSISQKATLEALTTTDNTQMQKMVQEFQSRRDILLQGLDAAKIPYVKPQGAFYVFCNIAKTGLNSITFSRELLEQAEVAVIPGIAFGKDDYVRLSFSTSAEQIREGTRRIKDWLKSRNR